MKSNKLIILFLFALNSVFSQEKIDHTSTQENHNKWSIEIGTGISDGTRPYSDGYYSKVNNNLFNNFKLNNFTVGATYNFSKIIGAKMDFSFDKFNNNKDVRTKPYEVVQYRVSLQAVFNLNNLIKPKNEPYRFNLLFHTGLNLASLKPIKSNITPKVSNGDHYGGIILGITPNFKISKKISLFMDFSSFSNYGQNLTWNGRHSDVSNNASGSMLAWNFGLSIYLGANKKNDDGQATTSSLDNDKDKLAAQNKVKNLEAKTLDTNGDGVIDALDEEKESVVDTKGRNKDLNNNNDGDKLADKVIAANPVTTKTDIKADTVPANTTTVEGIYAISGDAAKKLITDGYIAVYFNLGESKPTNDSKEAIGFVLTYLRNNPTVTVDILGKTDETGGTEMNNILATDRAQNVKNILIDAGIEPSRMTIISRGEDKSVNVKSGDARSLVRKVIFIIKG